MTSPTPASIRTPDPDRPRTPRPRRLAGAGIGLLLAGLLAAAAHQLAWHRGLDGLQAEAAARLEVEAARLESQLQRVGFLPSLLESAPPVLALLARPGDEALREAVNRSLGTLNALAAADNLYVLDRTGRVVAAADAGRPGTPLGIDLAFRPYVREALAGGAGRFYGVGITSGRAGYYLSYAIPSRGAALGVAVVKADLETPARAWIDLAGDVLVLDERGVVILASRDAWKYRPLAPMGDADRAEVVRSRRYGASGLVPLAWRFEPRRGRAGALVDTGATGARLAVERPVHGGRWRLLVLADPAPARATARGVAAIVALAAAAAGLLGVVLWQRRRALQVRLASRDALQAAHDSLEAEVQRRTAELRAAQADLVHAGQLAALGRLSAGLAHELNQPLAALRTLSDNAAVMMAQGRTEDVRANLARITALVDRLGRLTRQLKVLAHRSDEPPRAVPLARAVEAALALHAARLRDLRVEVDVSVEPPDLRVPGHEIRLEQVLANLVGNAADAMAGAPGMPFTGPRQLAITAAGGDGGVTVTVANSGPPIRDDILPRLFEPFVTSKPAGEGLGLGLAISARIVHDAGGTLRARNLPTGGVEFRIALPPAPGDPPDPDPDPAAHA